MAEPSRITEESLKATLAEKLQASHVDVKDISGGCGQAFTALVVSALFAHKTALARHRLVNAALRAEIAAIHAWTPRCYTPEEWERRLREEAASAGDSAEVPLPLGKPSAGEPGLGTAA